MKCPFCGVETEVPHETQQTCIHALQAEIVRVRVLLDASRPLQAGLDERATTAPDRGNTKEESNLPASSSTHTRTVEDD